MTLALYGGIPIITTPPDDSDDLTFEFRRLLSTLDDNLGIPDVYSLLTQSLQATQYRWSFAGRQANDDIRQMFYYLRGRAKSIWVPTFMSDFTLAQTTTTNTMVVQNSGYARLVATPALSSTEPQLWTDLRVALRDGTTHYTGIVSATEISPSQESLTLTSLPAGITPEQVQCISLMSQCRLDQDNVEINHVADADGLTQITISWVSTTASVANDTINDGDDGYDYGY